MLGLAGCQTKPPQTGLSAEQIAVLQEQGFRTPRRRLGVRHVEQGAVRQQSDRLNPDSRNTLTKIARALLAVDIDKVRLEGHTDNYGDEGYNQKLSERRAESVAAVFREAGMPAANIEVRGLGMSKPVADNKTRAGLREPPRRHHRSRRVILRSRAAYGPPVPGPSIARPRHYPLPAYVEGRSQQTGVPAAAAADARLNAAQETDNPGRPAACGCSGIHRQGYRPLPVRPRNRPSDDGRHAMNRHYYISDNLDELERLEAELEASGIATEQIHVLSERTRRPASAICTKSLRS